MERYTKRSNKPPEEMPASQVGTLSFIAGMMFMALIDMFFMGITG